MNTLIDVFKQVPDFRSSHGRSHLWWLLMLFMVMGILAGYQGCRPLQTFVEEHDQALCEVLA